MNKYVIFFLILALGCDPLDSRLIISNGSDSTAYYLLSEYENLESMYDQKLVDQGVKLTFKNYVYELNTGDERRHTRMGSSVVWEDYIDKVCENEKLHIYTFDIQKLQKYSWKEVTEHGYFKEKVSYSLDEIKNMEWRIVLP